MKSVKNYKYIFWFLVNVAITNAHIILSRFCPVSTSPASLKAFRLRLAEQLIGSYCSRKRAGWPGSTRSVAHPPPQLPPPEENGPPASQRRCTNRSLHLPSHQGKRRCINCREYRTCSRRRETVWYCKDCDRKGGWIKLLSALA